MIATTHKPRDRRLHERWIVSFEVTTTNRRAVAAMTTVGNGRWGTRVAGVRSDSEAETLASGVFDDAAVPDLLPVPTWAHLPLADMSDEADAPVEVATLDMWNATVERELRLEEGVVRAIYFSSVSEPELHAFRVTAPADLLDSDPIVVAPDAFSRREVSHDEDADISTVAVSSLSGESVAAAATQARRHIDPLTTSITRMAALVHSDSGPSTAVRMASEALGRSRSRGFHGHLDAHSAVWHERWRLAAIDMPDHPELETALRFAQFHLLMSASSEHEVAVGPRGLTGRAYRGHVFWDTDVFVTPALTAMAPELARATLQYRSNRLDVAQARAVREGCAGARFPWESAATGEEVTPTEGVGLDGHRVPIFTGEREEHIVADVAWAVHNYDVWTDDETFRRASTLPILMETARYWHSRAEIDDDGSAHLRGVIGPDEYHELVDDNAFTNVMASWNLRTAAELCRQFELIDDRVWRAWHHTAEQLVDGFDRVTKVHEQFAGFDRLERVLPQNIGEPPLAADMLVGHERIQHIQTIKQADVLMLHHMLPDLMPPGSLDADLDHYLPRTAHGSSLSPAITASVLARAGRTQEALQWFDLAADFDFTDVSGTTGAGVHLATMGGLWQAFSAGFLGLRPHRIDDSEQTVRDFGLSISPLMPPRWGTVTHRVVFRRNPIEFRVEHDTLRMKSASAIWLVLDSGDRRHSDSAIATRTDSGWVFR